MKTSFQLLMLILFASFYSCKKKTEEITINTFAVSTSEQVDSITGARAKLRGEVTGDGGSTVIERGFCGGLSQPVKLTDQNKIAVGDGVGSFSIRYNGFLPNTSYEVRAYAINNSHDTIYGNYIQFTTGNLAFGDYYQGGIFYYRDPNSTAENPHGLLAAKTDIGNAAWGLSTINVVTGDAVGDGQSNTTAMINAGAASGTAGYLCDNYTSEGYSDWYLPSVLELAHMYSNLKAQGMGDFIDAAYWSSSQADDPAGSFTIQELAKTKEFNGGAQGVYYRNNNYPRVRAVRSF